MIPVWLPTPVFLPPYHAPMPYDPLWLMYMMYAMAYMLAIPYYYSLTLEMYRGLIEAWRKTLDAMVAGARPGQG